jgi:hypothetical protein
VLRIVLVGRRGGFALDYVTTYKYVTTYETRLEPYTRLVTLYDTCGCAYTVTRTSYREVEVPVTKKVAVTERVAFCY